MDSDYSDNESNAEISNTEQSNTTNVRRRKPGIIYLSWIPESMNHNHVLDYFSKFGEITHKQFTEDEKKSERYKHRKVYKEAWLEFKSKRKAKLVEEMLNNTPTLFGKPSSTHYNSHWCIKYLPRFKWNHLFMRLDYENEVKEKRMEVEMSQVHKEYDSLIQSTVLQTIGSQKRKKSKDDDDDDDQIYKKVLMKKERFRDRGGYVKGEGLDSAVFVGSKKSNSRF